MKARFEAEGADAFADHELLEMFLFAPLVRVNTSEIAHKLLERFGSLEGVLTADEKSLMEVKGVGARTAQYIASCRESIESDFESEILSHPMSSFSRCANFFILHMTKNPFCAMFLDDKLNVISICDSEKDFHTQILSTEAKNVILAYKKDFETTLPDRSELLNLGIKLLDIIEVDSFDAKSITE